jgi:uncharacterized protein YjiS (DUF1127 family)
MATTTHYTAAPASSRLSAILLEAKDRLSRFALYRRTLRELGDLSDNLLADIGLNRSMIKRTALDAVYNDAS